MLESARFSAGAFPPTASVPWDIILSLDKYMRPSLNVLLEFCTDLRQRRPHPRPLLVFLIRNRPGAAPYPRVPSNLNQERHRWPSAQTISLATKPFQQVARSELNPFFRVSSIEGQPPLGRLPSQNQLPPPKTRFASHFPQFASYLQSIEGLEQMHCGPVSDHWYMRTFIVEHESRNLKWYGSTPFVVLWI